MRDWLLATLASWGIVIDERWQWATELFVVVVIVLTVNLLLRFAFIGLQRASAKTNNTWDDALVKATSGPLRLAIWVIGLAIAVSMAAMQSQAEHMLEWVEPVRTVGLALSFAWFLTRLIREMEQNVLERNRHKSQEEQFDAHSLEAISKLLRTAVIITTALIVLQNLGFSVSGVLAFGGIGGIAVGFAAKDILANFFGGLFIYLDKPFVVGDWISSPDQDIEGTVEHIGWRRTVIRRFNKRPLYVPNGTFNNISVENPSRMTNRRIYETIGIRYCDHAAMTKIVDDVRDYLENHDDIDTRQTLIVNFDRFNNSSLDFFIYTFTKTTDWVTFHQVKHAVLLDVYDIVRKHGGDVAFPTTTLDLPEALAEHLIPAAQDKTTDARETTSG